MQPQSVADENPFAAAEVKFDSLRAYLSSRALSHDHAQIEQHLWDEGLELLRLLLQAHLDLRADAERRRQVRDVASVLHDQVRSASRGLETVFGRVQVRRLSYGAPGVESLRPADADLHLPERLYSAGIQQRVAEAAAGGDRDAGLLVIGRSSLRERLESGTFDLDALAVA